MSLQFNITNYKHNQHQKRRAKYFDSFFLVVPNGPMLYYMLHVRKKCELEESKGKKKTKSITVGSAFILLI